MTETIPLPHRQNPDGTWHAICRRCFRTAARAETLNELREIEQAHICDPQNPAVPKAQSNRDMEDEMKDETIYVLRHEHEIDGYDSTIILGVFSLRSAAEESQIRFAKEPGFRDHPEGFFIHQCKIDEELWSGGFITERVGPAV